MKRCSTNSLIEKERERERADRCNWFVFNSFPCVISFTWPANDFSCFFKLHSIHSCKLQINSTYCSREFTHFALVLASLSLSLLRLLLSSSLSIRIPQGLNLCVELCEGTFITQCMDPVLCKLSDAYIQVPRPIQFGLFLSHHFSLSSSLFFRSFDLNL